MSEPEIEKLFGLMREVREAVSSVAKDIAVLAAQFTDHKALDEIRHKNDGKLFGDLLGGILEKGIWAIVVAVATFVAVRIAG